jgi:hypothetical protein
LGELVGLFLDQTLQNLFVFFEGCGDSDHLEERVEGEGGREGAVGGVEGGFGGLVDGKKPENEV